MNRRGTKSSYCNRCGQTLKKCQRLQKIYRHGQAKLFRLFPHPPPVQELGGVPGRFYGFWWKLNCDHLTSTGPGRIGFRRLLCSKGHTFTHLLIYSCSPSQTKTKITRKCVWRGTVKRVRNLYLNGAPESIFFPLCLGEKANEQDPLVLLSALCNSVYGDLLGNFGVGGCGWWEESLVLSSSLLAATGVGWGGVSIPVHRFTHQLRKLWLSPAV